MNPQPDPNSSLLKWAVICMLVGVAALIAATLSQFYGWPDFH